MIYICAIFNQITVTMFWKVFLTVLGAISALDILSFILSAFGNGSGAFTGGISRPLFGMLEMSMFGGFIVKLIEAALVAAAILIWF